jgi:hypothetical protein
MNIHLEVVVGFSVGSGGSKRRGNDADDGDHHKQLHQCECLLNARVSSHIGLDSSPSGHSRGCLRNGEVNNAAGPARTNWQQMRPASIRSSHLVGRVVHVSVNQFVSPKSY